MALCALLSSLSVRSVGSARGVAGVSASSLFPAESRPLLAGGIRLLSQSRGEPVQGLWQRAVCECDLRSRFTDPGVTGISSPLLVSSFVPGVRGAGLSQPPYQVLLCPCVPSPPAPSSDPPSGLIRGAPDEFCLENRLDLERERPLRRTVSAPGGPRLASRASGGGEKLGVQDRKREVGPSVQCSLTSVRAAVCKWTLGP